MLKQLKSLLITNPMNVDVKRYLRRYTDPRRSALNLVSVVLLVMMIGFFMLMIVQSGISWMPAICTILVTGVTLIIPITLFGCIASERERRSWDFLACAPVTTAQIATAKFITGLASAGMLFAFALPLMATDLLATRNDSWFSTSSNKDVEFNAAFGTLMVAFGWSMLLSGFCVLISARSKRAFTALGTILAVLLMALVIFPLIIATSPIGQEMRYLMNWIHPNYISGQLFDRDQSNALPLSIVALISFVYGLAGVLFVTWATYTIRFADNQMKFLPKKDA
jgi:ABC-type transport system involved in multi-copper enzyme maturation permease subunit